MLEEILTIYQKENKFLVLNPLVPSWIVTNKTGIYLIQEYLKQKSSKEVANNFCNINSNNTKSSVITFIDKLKNQNLFTIPNVQIHHPYNLSTVYLNVTEKCNLNCSYCYASARKEHNFEYLNKQDFIKLFDDIKKINSEMTIVFSGGEPLIYKDLFEIASYSKSLGFQNIILTNGTLISETNINLIKANFDKVKISLDGSTPEKHDIYRGKGSYNKTIKGINLLRKNNVNVMLAMVVTKENKADIKNMNSQWGNIMSYQPLFPFGNAENIKEKYIKGDEYYQALTEVGGINPYANISTIIDRHKQYRSLLKCSLGDGELSISCTGDVYPCQLLHYDKFLLGNIHQMNLIDIYNSPKNEEFKFSTVDKNVICKDCDLKYLCGGTCQARHFCETNDIHKAGTFCIYEKQAIIDGLFEKTEPFLF